MPQARVPRLYQQAIEEDQAMTARIAKGELTRAERRQRLENLAENIRLTELLNPPHTREQSADRELQTRSSWSTSSRCIAILCSTHSAADRDTPSAAFRRGSRNSRSPDYETEPA